MTSTNPYPDPEAEELLDEYETARVRAREALQLCLTGERSEAESLLHQVRTRLKRISGDLPIARHSGADPFTGESPGMALATRSFTEARAWGWLELASGVFQLARERPGASLMHFSRAWRIWRPWCKSRETTEQQEALRERVRASLWLGEAWARFVDERTERAANAVLRAALSELANLDANDLFQETIEQQSLLPPAPPGSAAYIAFQEGSGRSMPYVKRL